MARVRNRLRQIQVFNLPHAQCCKTTCRCTRTTVVNFVRYKDRFVPREEPRVNPLSVALLAGETKEVPPEFFNAPEVREALARGWIEKEEVKVKEAARTAPPAPEPVVRAPKAEPTPRRGPKLRGRKAGKEE